jgi:predicted ATP-dependent serine protease
MMTDGRALTLNQIIGQIVMAREKYGIQFVVVDYDQKIRMSGRGEEWQLVQKAVEDLEECAKANNVHIMLLAQGDEEGAVKSSKRAQQPAATIFEFTETNGKYAIRSKKNRFGARRWRMSVNADPSMSLVTEGELVDETQLELKSGESASTPGSKKWWEEKEK